ncbi:MAG TPA: gfo/Idh/MocA family oxidoreductase, partial [Acidimicrobiia bacterium]|nr:gfo/Idh/MocA family oxidoreductase [Acidimicrobiia bacterium]
VAYRTGDIVAPALDEAEALQRVMIEFADAIRRDRPPLTDGESGLRILEILEATSASTSAGGAMIPLTPDGSR